MESLMAMLEENPTDSFILYAVAKEHESLNNHENALAYFLQIKDQDPNYVGMYYHLGKLYEKLENSDLAISAYQEGIEIAKNLKDFHALSELNTAKLNLEMDL